MAMFQYLKTLTDLPKDIDAIIFTLGSDGQGRIGARAIDYGGVRNILRIFMDTPVRIAPDDNDWRN